MTDLLELAARCEAATGPDRELDDDIFAAMGLCKHRNRHFEVSDDPDELLGPEVCDDCGKRGSMAYPLLRYTASLDAAMTLVPEGWEVALYWGVKGFRPEAQLERDELHAKQPGFEPLTGTAETIALALCAAALKARHQSGDGE